MRIDAHHHLWQLGQFDYRWLDTEPHAPIRRDFLPADLRPLLDQAGIDRTVVVQTQHDLAENAWALALADAHPWIAGVVGWVDLRSAECERQLLAARQHPKFVGVRHVVQDEPDDFILRPDVARGLATLERHRVPYDLLFYARQLQHAATVAARFPDLPLVLDHLGKPDIRTGQWDDWAADLSRAAAFPNVYCKLSGLATEAHWDRWQSADLARYFELAIEAFGPQRCMYGSDWPVCLLAGNYDAIHQACSLVVDRLSETEQAWIWGETAVRFYGLVNED